MRLAIPILCCAMATGCSSVPQKIMGDRSISPDEVAEHLPEDKSLVIEWGGVIAQTDNLEKTTELQVIAYPLRDNGKPDLNKPPTGRFIAVYQGYLESADYRSGRSLSLSGTLLGVRVGKVGEADYRFPLVKPQEIRLWPVESAEEPKSRWHFGIGVGSGGSRGSIGVGIGL